MTVQVKAAGKWKPTPALRRSVVSLLAKKGMSNRAIAKTLKADEATIRRDLKFLRTPKGQRTVPRQKKSKRLTPEQRLKQMLKVIRQWVADLNLIRPHVLWVLPEVGKPLFQARERISTLPESPLSPAELLPATRPPNLKEDYLPDKLEACADWLVRWLAYCAPRDEKLQDEVLPIPHAGLKCRCSSSRRPMVTCLSGPWIVKVALFAPTR
jgi:hypothetical protein